MSIVAVSGSLLLSAGSAKAAWSVEPALHQAQERYHSGSAKKRLQAWRDLLESSRQLPERKQLQAVNHEINHQIRFSADEVVWQRPDYWATPVETLARGVGDCEDFALVKYFTLLQLGIPQEKLRITYAKALELNQAHMVVTYFATPDAEPLVLDNLLDSILPASQRKDLALRYAFNGHGLYAMKSGALRHIGEMGEVSFWQGLLARMKREGFRT
ncbi:transglutaminase-like cysteine peptidase [Pseudomonas sp. R-28-1W-6]|uniref:transglutaminase-like cysteine peptidase n=1 Tax=Pseudomonas sp. R-28-1W-6 TaxID=2650101 RepID=UPI002115B6A2|nr:transglutaminase-like cysteine peptidase [Pseudomonas sp. R-28-1W-6]